MRVSLVAFALCSLISIFGGAQAHAQYIPRDCGMAYPEYGAIAVGSAVVLGRHSPYRGDTWWNDAMDANVGRAAVVTALGGLDPAGCPYVRVDVDGGAFGWRIRDMSIGTAAAAPVLTELCTNMQAMDWLAHNAGAAAVSAPIVELRASACDHGLEAASEERWPNGTSLRSGSSWYYPNGITFYDGRSYYYPNGIAFYSGASYYYPNGITMRSGTTFYAMNGTTASESSLIAAALARLAGERGELLMTNYRASNEFWAMTYLAAMVIESQ
jgi:hypothetical protein